MCILVNKSNCSLFFQVDEVDESLLTQLAYNARGDICPMQGVIGGITAQEVMKVWPHVLRKHEEEYVCMQSWRFVLLW